MKNPLEKAEELVDTFRILLMKEDTQCGEEILCTTIAIQCALITVDEIIKTFDCTTPQSIENWEQVKQELTKQQQDEE
jgi:hypothetical protein